MAWWKLSSEASSPAASTTDSKMFWVFMGEIGWRSMAPLLGSSLFETRACAVCTELRKGHFFSDIYQKKNWNKKMRMEIKTTNISFKRPSRGSELCHNNLSCFQIYIMSILYISWNNLWYIRCAVLIERFGRQLTLRTNSQPVCNNSH